MFLTFTPEELEELRRFDAEIDAAPMEYENFLISDFVESLLFPERERERAKRREHSRQTYDRDKEKRKQYSREYRAAHKEEEAARRRAWYQANRDRVLAQQREYRRRKAEATAGEREARRAAARERKRAYDREYHKRRREAAAQQAGGLTAPAVLLDVIPCWHYIEGVMLHDRKRKGAKSLFADKNFTGGIRDRNQGPAYGSLFKIAAA